MRRIKKAMVWRSFAGRLAFPEIVPASTGPHFRQWPSFLCNNFFWSSKNNYFSSVFFQFAALLPTITRCLIKKANRKLCFVTSAFYLYEPANIFLCLVIPFFLICVVRVVWCPAFSVLLLVCSSGTLEVLFPFLCAETCRLCAGKKYQSK